MNARPVRAKSRSRGLETLTAVRSCPILFLQRRNNKMAKNLQMFTSSHSSRRFTACDQSSHWGFFHPDLFFRQPGCAGLIMKNRVKSVFFEVINSSATTAKFTSNFNVFNNIKMTLYNSKGIRKWGIGLTKKPWAWFFAKTLLPAQRRLFVFAYILPVNLST